MCLQSKDAKDQIYFRFNGRSIHLNIYATNKKYFLFMLKVNLGINW